MAKSNKKKRRSKLAAERFDARTLRRRSILKGFRLAVFRPTLEPSTPQSRLWEISDRVERLGISITGRKISDEEFISELKGITPLRFIGFARISRSSHAQVIDPFEVKSFGKVSQLDLIIEFGRSIELVEAYPHLFFMGDVPEAYDTLHKWLEYIRVSGPKSDLMALAMKRMSDNKADPLKKP